MFRQELINSVFTAYSLHTKFNWLDWPTRAPWNNAVIVELKLLERRKTCSYFAIVDILSDFGLDPLADHVFVHFSWESAPADCLKKPQPCRVWFKFRKPPKSPRAEKEAPLVWRNQPLSAPWCNGGAGAKNRQNFGQFSYSEHLIICMKFLLIIWS